MVIETDPKVPEKSYKEFLQDAATRLQDAGEYTADLNSAQVVGLTREIVQEVAAELPVKVTVEDLNVSIADKRATVQSTLKAGIGPVSKNVKGEVVLANAQEAQDKVQVAGITTEPPVISIPKVAMPVVRRVASAVAGHDVEVPSEINIGDQLRNGLEKAGGIDGAMQSALNKQLSKSDITVTGIGLQITEANTLNIRMSGGRRDRRTNAG